MKKIQVSLSDVANWLLSSRQPGASRAGTGLATVRAGDAIYEVNVQRVYGGGGLLRDGLRHEIVAADRLYDGNKSEPVNPAMFELVP